MLVAQDMTTRPDLSPWLAGVYVSREHRRRGIATSLITRIEAEARSLGSSVLYLYTESAQSLYGHLGWSAIEHCMYQGVDVAIMSKKLA